MNFVGIVSGPMTVAVAAVAAVALIPVVQTAAEVYILFG